jgi:hypothetical protein
MKRTLILPGGLAFVLRGSLAVMRSSAIGPVVIQKGVFSLGCWGWEHYPGQGTTIVQSLGGALSVTNTADTASGFGFSAVQCVPIDADYEHTLAGEARVPAGQGRTGIAQVWVTTFASADCAGSSTASPGLQLVSSDAWVDDYEHFVPPAGTQSVLVILYGLTNEAAPNEDPTADFTVEFDNISLVQRYRVRGVTLEICKWIEDNGDAYADSGTFTYEVGLQGQPPFVTDFAVLASEALGGCQVVEFDDYGVEVPPSTLLYVHENPLPGWTNQAGPDVLGERRSHTSARTPPGEPRWRVHRLHEQASCG